MGQPLGCYCMLHVIPVLPRLQIPVMWLTHSATIENYGGPPSKSLTCSSITSILFPHTHWNTNTDQTNTFHGQHHSWGTKKMMLKTKFVARLFQLIPGLCLHVSTPLYPFAKGHWGSKSNTRTLSGSLHQLLRMGRDLQMDRQTNIEQNFNIINCYLECNCVS